MMFIAVKPAGLITRDGMVYIADTRDLTIEAVPVSELDCIDVHGLSRMMRDPYLYDSGAFDMLRPNMRDGIFYWYRQQWNYRGCPIPIGFSYGVLEVAGLRLYIGSSGTRLHYPYLYRGMIVLRFVDEDRVVTFVLDGKCSAVAAWNSFGDIAGSDVNRLRAEIDLVMGGI